MAQSLPPAVEFFLRETSDQPDVPGPFAAWLKRSGVSKELQARAEETIKQFKYADDRNTPVEPTGRFTVCPSGALDPMSPTMAVAAFAGALAAMNAIHPHVAKDETDAARQETLSAYILWKAHNLLAHRE